MGLGVNEKVFQNAISSYTTYAGALRTEIEDLRANLVLLSNYWEGPYAKAAITAYNQYAKGLYNINVNYVQIITKNLVEYYNSKTNSNVKPRIWPIKSTTQQAIQVSDTTFKYDSTYVEKYKKSVETSLNAIVNRLEQLNKILTSSNILASCKLINIRWSNYKSDYQYLQKVKQDILTKLNANLSQVKQSQLISKKSVKISEVEQRCATFYDYSLSIRNYASDIYKNFYNLPQYWTGSVANKAIGVYNQYHNLLTKYIVLFCGNSLSTWKTVYNKISAGKKYSKSATVDGCGIDKTVKTTAKVIKYNKSKVVAMYYEIKSDIENIDNCMIKEYNYLNANDPTSHLYQSTCKLAQYHDYITNFRNTAKSFMSELAKIINSMK